MSTFAEGVPTMPEVQALNVDNVSLFPVKPKLIHNVYVFQLITLITAKIIANQGNISPC